MKIKDLQEGVNIHRGYYLPNYDDSSTIVWELNRNVLSNWISKMRFTGAEECHIRMELGRTIVFVPSIEQSRNNYINEKAATIESWNTNN